MSNRIILFIIFCIALYIAITVSHEIFYFCIAFDIYILHIRMMYLFSCFLVYCIYYSYSYYICTMDSELQYTKANCSYSIWLFTVFIFHIYFCSNICTFHEYGLNYCIVLYIRIINWFIWFILCISSDLIAGILFERGRFSPQWSWPRQNKNRMVTIILVFSLDLQGRLPPELQRFLWLSKTKTAVQVGGNNFYVWFVQS